MFVRNGNTINLVNPGNIYLGFTFKYCYWKEQNTVAICIILEGNSVRFICCQQ